jgi:hypothetical protein
VNWLSCSEKNYKWESDYAAYPGIPPKTSPREVGKRGLSFHPVLMAGVHVVKRAF